MQPELQTSTTGYGTVAISPGSQKVLRNTYMLLALTMVPTIAGAWLGIELAPVMMASPIITMVAMLAGVALLLLMTLLMGVFIGPLLNVALQMRNGMQLVGYAAAGTGIIFFGMGTLAATIKRDLAPSRSRRSR